MGSEGHDSAPKACNSQRPTEYKFRITQEEVSDMGDCHSCATFCSLSFLCTPFCYARRAEMPFGALAQASCHVSQC